MRVAGHQKRLKSKSQFMTPVADKPDPNARRKAVRLTAWIVGLTAFAIYAFSIIEAVLTR